MKTMTSCIDRRLAESVRPGIRVTPLEHGDTETVAEVFEAMGSSSLYYRFHMGVPRVSTSMLRLLSAVEPGRQYIAVAWAGDRPIGHGQLVRTRPGVAELAMAVADLWQRQGVGAALFRHLAHYSAYAGFEQLTCFVHPENRRVARLLRDAGAQPSGEPGEWLIDVCRWARLDPMAARLALPDPVVPVRARELAASGSSI